MKESISVIIPVFNASNTILECVNSVIGELVSNDYPWEIILVDDCSTDNSLEMMCKSYGDGSKFSDKISIIRTLTNSGVSTARNEGLKLSKGTIIAFNDSDDRWLPGRIKIQMEYLCCHPDVSMVAGIYGNDKVNVIRTLREEEHISIKDQIFKNYFSPQNVLFRRSILKDIGLFLPQMRYAEEGFFFNRMVYYKKCILLKVVVAESIIGKKRWGDLGLSGNLLEMEKGELFNLKMAYQSKFIPFYLYIFVVSFSLLKFLRRVLLSFYFKSIKSV